VVNHAEMTGFDRAAWSGGRKADGFEAIEELADVGKGKRHGRGCVLLFDHCSSRLS
jgi:hypothetical protein